MHGRIDWFAIVCLEGFLNMTEVNTYTWERAAGLIFRHLQLQRGHASIRDDMQVEGYGKQCERIKSEKLDPVDRKYDGSNGGVKLWFAMTGFGDEVRDEYIECEKNWRLIEAQNRWAKEVSVYALLINNKTDIENVTEEELVRAKSLAVSELNDSQERIMSRLRIHSLKEQDRKKASGDRQGADFKGIQVDAVSEEAARYEKIVEAEYKKPCSREPDGKVNCQ